MVVAMTPSQQIHADRSTNLALWYTSASVFPVMLQASFPVNAMFGSCNGGVVFENSNPSVSLRFPVDTSRPTTVFVKQDIHNRTSNILFTRSAVVVVFFVVFVFCMLSHGGGLRTADPVATF